MAISRRADGQKTGIFFDLWGSPGVSQPPKTLPGVGLKKDPQLQ